MSHSIRKLLLGGAAVLATCPALAGDVTPDRLVNADKEPQNWLMNHRTYDANAIRRSTRSTRTTSRA